MGISSATAQVVPDPIKTPTNLSDTTVRRCRRSKNCKTKLEKLKNVLNVGHTSTTQYKQFSIYVKNTAATGIAQKICTALFLLGSLKKKNIEIHKT